MQGTGYHICNGKELLTQLEARRTIKGSTRYHYDGMSATEVHSCTAITTVKGSTTVTCESMPESDE